MKIGSIGKLLGLLLRTFNDIGNRERIVTRSITFRNYDRSRITLVRGGSRLEAAPELWLVPSDSFPPAPANLLPDSPRSTRTSSLFGTRGPEGSLEEFVLDSVRQREANARSRSEKTEAGIAPSRRRMATRKASGSAGLTSTYRLTFPRRKDRRSGLFISPTISGTTSRPHSIYRRRARSSGGARRTFKSSANRPVRWLRRIVACRILVYSGRRHRPETASRRKM